VLLFVNRWLVCQIESQVLNQVMFGVILNLAIRALLLVVVVPCRIPVFFLFNLVVNLEQLQIAALTHIAVSHNQNKTGIVVTQKIRKRDTLLFIALLSRSFILNLYFLFNRFGLGRFRCQIYHALFVLQESNREGSYKVWQALLVVNGVLRLDLEFV